MGNLRNQALLFGAKETLTREQLKKILGGDLTRYCLIPPCTPSDDTCGTDYKCVGYICYDINGPIGGVRSYTCMPTVLEI